MPPTICHNDNYLNKCYPELISKCDKRCEDTSLIELCEHRDWYFPIFGGGYVFKNIYCLQCNGINNFLCMNESAYESQCNQRNPGIYEQYSFSRLLDFRPLMRDTNECDITERPIPETNICRKIVCVVNGTVINETCNANDTSPVCDGIALHPNDYILNKTKLTIVYSQNEFNNDEYYRHKTLIILCNASNSVNGIFKVVTGQGLLTISLLAVSILFLFYRICHQICSSSSKFKNAAGLLQCNLVMALLLASLLQLFSPIMADYHLRNLCSVLGVFKYYAYLCVFSWTLFISIDMYFVVQRSISCVQDNPHRSVLKQVVTTWVIPTVVACGVYSLEYLSVNYQPRFGGPSCWFMNGKLLLYCFVLPVAVCELVGIFIFILMSYSLHKAFTLSEAVQKKAKQNKNNMKVYLKIFVILGLSWIIGFMDSFLHSDILTYLNTILTPSQGTLVVFVYMVDWKSVIDKLKCYKKNTIHPNSTTLVTITSVEQVQADG